MKKIIFTVVVLFSGFVQAEYDGEHLYEVNCAACHGLDGEGGVGVPISLPSFINSVDDTFIKTTIIMGREGRVMPSFKELGDEKINALVHYVRQWGSKTPPKRNEEKIVGDVLKGAKLFAQHCTVCHGEKGEGGHGTGVTFSRQRDLPIFAPGLNNAGFLASATDHTIKLILENGRLGTPMVSFLDRGLSDEDLNNLVAFVRDFENNPLEKLNEDVEENVLLIESPYGMQQTIKLIEAAIVGNNFTHIRTQYFEEGFVEHGKESKKQAIVYFCNFKFLHEALNIDPRAGLFLPCRVTIVEHEGVVKLMVVNPKRLSKLFNNRELSTACDAMLDVYADILDDSTL